MSTLEKFQTILLNASAADIEQDSSLRGQLSLVREGKLRIDYAPFEHVQRGAKIVIAGITPGQLQAQNALKKAREVLAAGGTMQEAQAAAKVFASFSGPMRNNLVAMLDHIGMNKRLGIRTTETLWGEHSHLVHFTSVLRNPVYFNLKNYSGNPAITSVSALTAMLDSTLTNEVEQLRDAVWVPLGPTATAGLQWLVAKGVLSERKLLSGLPHPSGANAERIAYFLERKPKAELSAKTSPDKIDEEKKTLLMKMRNLAMQ